MVAGLALQMLGDAAEAEDAAQATFLQVHRYLGRFRNESSIETWVYRIAMREAALRARQRAERRFRLAAGVGRVGSAGSSDAGSDQGADLLVAMQKLSEDHRAVLSLLHLRELPVRQVAEILGVPEGTVWSRAHAARRELRGVVEGEGVRMEARR
jgi:RNA polymerase sigma-70 factor, ECF subfamily